MERGYVHIRIFVEDPVVRTAEIHKLRTLRYGWFLPRHRFRKSQNRFRRICPKVLENTDNVSLLTSFLAPILLPERLGPQRHFLWPSPVHTGVKRLTDAVHAFDNVLGCNQVGAPRGPQRFW